MSNFDASLLFTLENEGAFSDDPLDRGGATRWGITRGQAEKWLKHPVSIADMRTLPLSTARAIYFNWYWQALSLDQIHEDGIATAIFDCSAIRGTEVATKYAQMVCRDRGSEIEDDGIMGALTTLSINGVSLEDFIPAYAQYVREGFEMIVRLHPEQETFLKGWLARADRLLELTHES